MKDGRAAAVTQNASELSMALPLITEATADNQEVTEFYVCIGD